MTPWEPPFWHFSYKNHYIADIWKIWHGSAKRMTALDSADPNQSKNHSRIFVPIFRPQILSQCNNKTNGLMPLKMIQVKRYRSRRRSKCYMTRTFSIRRLLVAMAHPQRQSFDIRWTKIASRERKEGKILMEMVLQTIHFLNQSYTKTNGKKIES